jgi:D-lyxose ketol-isomerase
MKKIIAFLLMGLVSMSLMTGCNEVAQDYTGLTPFSPVPQLASSAFYKADGSFDQAVAKSAYFDMMKAYHYPISAMLKSDSLWTADFIQGDFAKLGMAGIFWKNVEGIYGNVGTKAYQGEFKDQNYGYLGHEIFLLPGQMLPEHNHLGNGSEKGFGPKMETWHIRHGSVEFFGEHKGEAGETLISEMPKDELPWGYGKDWFKSKYIAKLDAGGIYSLNDPESFHFMRAGKNGAIVAEYATYHNDVKFSDPEMQFGNSEAEKITKLKK